MCFSSLSSVVKMSLTRKRKKPTICHTLEKLKWPGSLPKQGSPLCPPTSLFEIVVIGLYQHLQHTQQVQGKADGKKISIFGSLLMLPCWPLLGQTGTVHSTYWTYWWMMLSSDDQILLNQFLHLANTTHAVIKKMPTSSWEQHAWCCPVLQS